MHAPSIKECKFECCAPQQPLPSNVIDSLHPLDDLDVLSSLPLCLLPRDKQKVFQSISQLLCSPDELGILQRWKREELHDESLPISPISPALYGRNMILAFSEDQRIDSLYGLCKVAPVPTSPAMLSL
ncbi:hypothetical protein WA577_003714, partial [Blastocystis sp. JDR]